MNALQVRWQRLLPHPLARRLALVVLVKVAVLAVLFRVAAAWLPAPRTDAAAVRQALFGTPAADPTEVPEGVQP